MANKGFLQDQNEGVSNSLTPSPAASEKSLQNAVEGKLLKSADGCYTVLNTTAASARTPPNDRMTSGQISTSGTPGRRTILQRIKSNALMAAFAIAFFYFSLLATSLPLEHHQRETVDRAIAILEQKGFEREAFLLRHTVSYRSSDHWLNRFVFSENAYAATNFPVQIITIYPDFYNKAEDDTERAMILLHESRHLMGEGEHEAYAYVWQNRQRLGWTILTHGTTPTYVTIEEITRENAPELFTCSDKLWNDCTEMARNRTAQSRQ
jgi:hypothetical protein